jgi:hypothetical protein
VILGVRRLGGPDCLTPGTERDRKSMVRRDAAPPDDVAMLPMASAAARMGS